MKQQLSIFEEIEDSGKKNVVNVASVPQRSPFRYAGGKTWLIPEVRKWLKQSNQAVPLLIEPFAGGGIVSLTAAFEKLADEIIMVELDNEVHAVWETILSENNKWLADRIFQFELTIENINGEFCKDDKSVRDIAFCTILKNRTYHGGILAKGAGFLKAGENGKGILSRWYPKTLRDRITAIDYVKNKITALEGSAFDVLNKYKNEKDAWFFIDPPYSVAGKRLYTHYEIDHELLFKSVSELQGKFLLIYDNTEYIRDLARKYGLKLATIPMKTTLHYEKEELLISDNFELVVMYHTLFR